MGFAYPKQAFQDWVTQQWAIFRGKKITLDEVPWLMGPFGSTSGIGEAFINELAKKENLSIERNTKSSGLISSIQDLDLPQAELARLSKQIIDFYQHTADYHLDVTLKWNLIFKFLGILINKLFSNRINQLNIPTKDLRSNESLTSEIIKLSEPDTNKVKYTIWLRTFRSSGRIIYSGVYGICKLPNGQACIKAVFPLPRGNATVIMTPSVGKDGELILDSSGKKMGDPGFYFLLNDSKDKYWTQFIPSFRDRLTIAVKEKELFAKQTLTLGHKKVLEFHYKISQVTV